MGLLSRNRKVPRIVKKRKTPVKQQKKISVKNLDPNIRVNSITYRFIRDIGIKRSQFKRTFRTWVLPLA